MLLSPLSKSAELGKEWKGICAHNKTGKNDVTFKFMGSKEVFMLV